MSQLINIFSTEFKGDTFQLESESSLRKFTLKRNGKHSIKLIRWFGENSVSKIAEIQDDYFQIRCKKIVGHKCVLVIGLYISNLPYKMALYDLGAKKQLSMSQLPSTFML
jgi:hypothetical protein